MGNFLAELKRRNVFKVATIYVVVSWLILQVATIVFPVFEIPLWASRLVVILLGLGLPIAVLMAWAFDLTPEGIAWADDEGDHHVHTHAWDWILGILLVVVIGLIVASEVRNWSAGSGQVDASVTSEPAPEQSIADDTEDTSIAVLPFVNMSDDPSNEYFSDGMAEEILNLLAKIPSLKVIGRTSSFAFKDKSEDLRVIGETLGVDALVEGSVRRSGDRVRITAQLIDSADGSNIWSETYERTMTDIFAVQDDVAAAVITALKLHIGVNPTRGRPTDKPDAYALFLRSRAAANAFDLVDAESLALEAIDVDSSFAEAYELLASIYWAQAGSILTAPDAQKLMGESAASALAIDSELIVAKALFESGNIGSYSPLVEIEALENAIREQPDNPWTLGTLVFNLVKAGYLKEALTVAERLVELDPVSAIANGRLNVALVANGRIGDAFAALDDLAALDFEQNNWLIGEANLVSKRDIVAVEQFIIDLRQNGITDTDWVRELIAGGGDSDNGQAYLDRRIPEVVASVPEEFRYTLERRLAHWYLYFGFLDRYYEIILQQDLTDETWSDADDLISIGTIHRQMGFTAHPRYLDVAPRLGYVTVWENRGPPDFCEKQSGQWVCR